MRRRCFVFLVSVLSITACFVFTQVTLYFTGGIKLGAHGSESNMSNKGSQRNIQHKPCTAMFKTVLNENLHIVRNYPRGVADKYLMKIVGNMTSSAPSAQLPVIVTALDTMFYPASMGMFQSVHKLMEEYQNGIKLIVYDLGLTDRQQRIVKQKCQCQFRSFPFDEFPEHVSNLNTYAFKPIIIQMALKEHGFVWWMDTSVRLTTRRIEPVLEAVADHGLLFSVNSDPQHKLAITKQTDPQTLKFLNEDPCLYRNHSETSATTIVLKSGPVVNTLVKAWVICALNENCIAPPGTNKKKVCDLNNQSDGRCHRFDQSALSILTRRLFNDKIESGDSKEFTSILKTVTTIQRGQIVNYFENCNLILKCLA